tara:strand:- start:6835 stop:7056 length:222 start_codon:yes stop_codon:yes gene_type:complete
MLDESLIKKLNVVEDAVLRLSSLGELTAEELEAFDTLVDRLLEEHPDRRYREMQADREQTAFKVVDSLIESKQ